MYETVLYKMSNCQLDCFFSGDSASKVTSAKYAASSSTRGATSSFLSYALGPTAASTRM